MGKHATVQLVCPFTQEQVDIDVGVVEDVKKLWAAGIQTWTSCQGDDEWNRYIMVRPDDVERARVLLSWVVSTWDNKHGWVALDDRDRDRVSA